jgi:hypothetical protein
METLVFLALVVGLLLFLLQRGRAGSGSGGYVPGGERMDLHEDAANLRAGHFPGAGGPIKGSGGGNVSGGG